MNSLNKIICVVAVLLGSACASTPPPTDILEAADAAALRAASVGALEYAPLELKYAREKLAAARSALEARDFEAAGWQAEQSEVNSELAVAKTIAAKARDASRAKSQENERLRDELGDERQPR